MFSIEHLSLYSFLFANLPNVDNLKKLTKGCSHCLSKKSNSFIEFESRGSHAAMPQCLVKTCGNYHGKTRGTRSVIYHMLPTNPFLYEKWVELCTTKKNFKVNAHVRVCSDHFSKNCYQRDLQHELLGLPSRRRLIPGALPDRKLPRDASTKADKIPMRSSTRIAKKKSIESLNGSFAAGPPNFSDKVKFMAELFLKFERKEFTRVKLPTYDFNMSLKKILKLQENEVSSR